MNRTAISRVVAESGRLFLFVSRSNAYIVPKRAFADEAQFKAFVDAALERWEQARQ